MGTFFVRAGLTMLLFALLPGCATLFPDKKPASRLPPPIVEQDIPARDQEQPGTSSQEQTSPTVTQPLYPPGTEPAPPVVEPGHQSPRRIPWRDSTGHGRGWKRGEDPQATKGY